MQVLEISSKYYKVKKKREQLEKRLKSVGHEDGLVEKIGQLLEVERNARHVVIGLTYKRNQ
jgi:hypothetical protein